MTLNSVFIGLVSHSKSTFPESQGPSGLAAELIESFAQLGVKCQIQINTRDFFDENSFPITSAMARASIREEIRLESQWSSFLGRADRVREIKRIAGRYGKFAISWRENSQPSELRRLLNIEYSHVDLYRSAVELGSDWALILEDDAAGADVDGLTRGLVDLFQSKIQPKYINLSASFPLVALGVQHLLTINSTAQWKGSQARIVYQSERPATNTVCAIAFRTEFLSQILADFDSQPTSSSEPVVPIDWKLNASLMRLWEKGAIESNECWFVEPAPIIQLSMVQDRAGN